MDQDLLNAYIDALNNSVSDLTKKNLVLQAQLNVAEKQRDAAIAAYASELELKEKALKKKKPEKTDDTF